jgi:hypothetical protein
MNTLRSFGALCAATLALSPALAVEHCYDFSRMPVGTVYRVGDIYEDDNLSVHMRDFYVGGVAVTPNNVDAPKVTVSNTALAQDASPEILTYLMNAQVIPRQPLRKVTMKVAQNVGHDGQARANLGVNGELREFVGSIAQADGKKMGDANRGRVQLEIDLVPDVSTPENPSFWHRGTLTMTGVDGALIDRFAFGGMSLAADRVCFEYSPN